MKKRDYRKSAPGGLVHIFNRGNNKEKIFLDDQDYRAFMFRLGLALGFSEKELKEDEMFSLPYSRVRITGAKKNDFKLHSFCLMPNHFHLLIEQRADTPLSILLLKICTSYAKYLNNKYHRVGHVFQDDFKSVLIESNPQLMWVSAYIHMNPVKDHLVKHPAEYKWSSYQDFTNSRRNPIVHKDFLNDIFGLKNFEKETLAYAVKTTL